MLHLGINRLGGRLELIQLEVTKQAYLVEARQKHLSRAIKDGFTHFMSFDDDQTFPANIIERCLEADKPIVVANYRKKLPNEVTCVCTAMDGKYLDSTNKTGLEQVVGIGMGCTFIQIDKMKHVPGPYFAVLWDKAKDRLVIEDGVFSEIMRANGIEMWADHDLSREVGHIGEVTYLVPPLNLKEEVK